MNRNSTKLFEKRRWLAGALIVLLGGMAYLNTFQAPFIFDDHNSITNNPHIRTPRPLSHALSAPPQSTVAGRPVVSLTLAINYAISGLEPWSYHLVNLLIHLGSSLLLLALVLRTSSSPNAPRALAGSSGLWAFAIAAIWTVHPLATEAVTYVSTRTESLAGLLILATVYLAARGFDSQRPVRWYAAAITTAFLAMGAKETAAALPLIVLAYDRVFQSDSLRTAFSRRRGLYLGLASSWLFLATLIAGGHRSETVGYGFSNITAIDYLRTQIGVIFHYMGLALWPHPLCLDYSGWPIARTMTPSVAIGGLVLATLLILAIVGTMRGSWAGFLGLWFFLLLGPSSSFLPIISEIAAERRMYLPLATVVALVVAGLWRLTRLTAGARHRLVFTFVTSIIVIGLALTTSARNEAYKTAESIWRDTITVRPDNGRAHANLGRILAVQGRSAEAEKHLRRAIELDPDAVEARDNLSTLLLEHGQTGEALENLEEAVNARPQDALTRIHLGNAQLAGGDPASALESFEAAIRMQPENGVAHSRKGSALAELGRLDEALAVQQRALELDPNHVLIRLDLGKLHMRLGDPDSAVAQFQPAVELEPENIDARNSLAAAFLASGRPDVARRHFDASIGRQPTSAAHFGLARLAAGQGDLPEAESQLRSCLQLDPGAADARLFLASILADTGRESEAEGHLRSALAQRPGWGSAGNALARLLATADDPTVRNPTEAVRIAEELCRASQFRHPVLLETLVISYSADGRFAEARETAIHGVEVARLAGAHDIADRLASVYE